MRNASSLETRRADINRSSALAWPTMCGSIQLMPCSAIQPAARERCREDGIVGGKAQVAIQRVHETDAGSGAVQHADHGFGNRRIVCVAGLSVGPAGHIETRPALRPAFGTGVER